MRHAQAHRERGAVVKGGIKEDISQNRHVRAQREREGEVRYMEI